MDARYAATAIASILVAEPGLNRSGISGLEKLLLNVAPRGTRLKFLQTGDRARRRRIRHSIHPLKYHAATLRGKRVMRSIQIIYWRIRQVAHTIASIRYM